MKEDISLGVSDTELLLIIRSGPSHVRKMAESYHFSINRLWFSFNTILFLWVI